MAIHKRGFHTANKHLTGYAPASVIRELQIRTVIYHVVPSSLHLLHQIGKNYKVRKYQVLARMWQTTAGNSVYQHSHSRE